MTRSSTPLSTEKPLLLSRKHPSALSLVLAVAALEVLASAPLSSWQSGVSDTTTVRRVEVPVYVSLGGEALTGLQSTDFRLEIDGEPTPIAGVVESSPRSSGSASPAPSVKDEGRTVLLFFDQSLTELALVEAARRGIQGALLSGLGRNDLVGVAYHQDPGGLSIVMPFSRDRGQLVRALNADASSQQTSQADPLGLIVSSGPDSATVRSPRPSKSGHSARARSQLTDDSARGFGLVESLSKLARRLADIPGRKELVLFSRGIPDKVLVGNEPGRPDFRAFSTSRVAHVGDVDEFGDQALRSGLEEAARELAAAGVVVFGVDLGTVGSSKSTGIESLRELGSSTGGSVFQYAGIAEVFEKFVSMGSHSYTLAFDPALLASSGTGRVRRIKVVLENGPRRAKISHRESFLDIPADFRDPLVDAHRVALGRTGGDLDVELRVLASLPGSAQEAVSPIVVEVSGASILGRREAGNIVPIEILAYAFSSEGEIVDHFAERVQLDLRVVGKRLETSGFLFLGSLAHSNSPTALRVLVRIRDGRSSVTIGSTGAPKGQRGGTFAQMLFPADPAWILAPGKSAHGVASSFVPVEGFRPTLAVPSVDAGSPLEVLVVPESEGTISVLAFSLLSEDGTSNDLRVVQEKALQRGARVATVLVPQGLSAGRYTLLLADSGTPGAGRAIGGELVDVR